MNVRVRLQTVRQRPLIVSCFTPKLHSGILRKTLKPSNTSPFDCYIIPFMFPQLPAIMSGDLAV